MLKIQFFIKETGEILTNTNHVYFVMNDVVFSRNAIKFEKAPHIGWRVGE